MQLAQQLASMSGFDSRITKSSDGIVVATDSKVKHTATVIFLHGFGDSGSGWLDVAEVHACL